MSTKLVKAKPTSAEIEKGRWQIIRGFVDQAGRFAHAGLTCQVMAGFELIELRKLHGVQGQRSDLEGVLNVEHRLPWPDACKLYAGISDDTARNWMRMAEAMRPRLKRLKGESRLRALMETPVQEWGPKDLTFIHKAVREIADGRSQVEFMSSLGLAPKRELPAREVAAPLDEDTAYMAKRAAAQRRLHELKTQLHIEIIQDQSFNYLETGDVEAMRILLAEALQQMDAVIDSRKKDAVAAAKPAKKSPHQQPASTPV